LQTKFCLYLVFYVGFARDAKELTGDFPASLFRDLTPRRALCSIVQCSPRLRFLPIFPISVYRRLEGPGTGLIRKINKTKEIGFQYFGDTGGLVAWFLGRGLSRLLERGSCIPGA